MAGISISMLSGDNSILQKATDAKQNSERAEAKEQAQMDIMAYISDKTANHEDSTLDDTKVKGILTGKSYVKTAGDTSFTAAKGEYVIPYSELYTATETTPNTSTATLPAGTYTVGQEITFGDEQFFVVADDGNSVRLLAKYCLNQEGTAQTDKNATTDGSNDTESYGRQFSQTGYWTDDVDGSFFDLQSLAMIEEARTDGTTIQNAVLTAIAYGERKGVSGRLITHSEASAMQSTNSDILFGTWIDGTQPAQGYLYWWVGNAYQYSSGAAYAVLGPPLYIYYGTYNSTWAGVRPVLVVPKS